MTLLSSLAAPASPLQISPAPSDKALQRKASHSKVEKNRRIKTNARLEQLKDLLPSFNAPSSKLDIIESAILHIENLHRALLEKELGNMSPLSSNESFVHDDRQGYHKVDVQDLLLRSD